MIELSRAIPAFAPTINAYVRGAPDAILLVEFAGADREEQVRGVKRLVELMGDLGFPGGVVELLDPAQQKELWEVRKAGLNIMMSMKGDGKPVSFIEDCAVPLEHLAEYTAKLTDVFRKHGTEGTFYAHASVGCLHVRPILNMKGDGTIRMRAIAEEAADLVRRYKGAYSGEHGDGLVRSEWIAPFFGPRLTAALSEIKGWFDPKGLMNPGKIVNPSRADDRSLLRYKPGYRAEAPATVLDWSAWGGLPGAVEMCNNNGHCRKFDAGTMCPSYRATRDETHLTRGRANTLRLALSGQLGAEGFASAAVREAFDLCVSCKGCRRECPTGVDMARMKIEYLHHDRARNGYSVRDRLVGMLPAYAPWASRFASLVNAAQRLPGTSHVVRALAGFDARRTLPSFSPAVLARRTAGPRSRRTSPGAALRRHLQQLVRARQPCRRGPGHGRGRLRCRTAARRFRATSLLRKDLPVGGNGRSRQGGIAAHDRCARPVDRAGHRRSWDSSLRACTRCTTSSWRCIRGTRARRRCRNWP